ncbi:MAG: CYTH domain-containing protein [Bacteroidota bacterium]
MLLLVLPTVLAAQNSGRIESEYKLKVPREQASAIWQFLSDHYGPQGIKTIDTAFQSNLSEEIFYDQYFDDDQQSLYQHAAGARFRQRFVKDSLVKELVQLKLPLGDSLGVARQEIKFNVYRKIKKKDRQAMHPFWQHVRPKNRDEVDLQLASFNLRGNDLRPQVKVKQIRKRVYVSEQGEALMTMTLDEVSSAYFPYPTFVELELELNEIRYTEGDLLERKRMEAINQELKDQLTQRFPELQQDQTPKYNKMVHLLRGNVWLLLYDNLMYLILALLVAYAAFLFGQQYFSLQTKAA